MLSARALRLPLLLLAVQTIPHVAFGEDVATVNAPELLGHSEILESLYQETHRLRTGARPEAMLGAAPTVDLRTTNLLAPVEDQVRCGV